MRAWAPALWILLWAFVASLRQSAMLPGPFEILRILIQGLASLDFWARSLQSIATVVLGFLPAFFGGLALGVWIVPHRRIADCIAPLILTMRAIPVASFVIFAVFFLSAVYLPAIVVFFIVFPIAYTHGQTARQAMDPKLLEMAMVFRFSKMRLCRHLLLPEGAHHFRAAWKSAYGLAWKAGVAAEVIVPSARSIGSALYDAKVTFDLSGLFAWTLWLILLSMGTGWILFRVFALLFKVLVHPGPNQTSVRPFVRQMPSLVLQGVNVHFAEQRVLSDVSLTLEEGLTRLSGPSGIGKTTLLRVLAGTLRPSSGRVGGDPLRKVSMVFQEDRLIESLTVVENLRLVGPTDEKIHAALSGVGLSQAADRPVSACSGGMRRRVALLRAFLAEGDILLLDEPSKGLDSQTLKQTIFFCRSMQPAFPAIILATHVEEEAEEWNPDRVWTLKREGLFRFCPPKG